MADFTKDDLYKSFTACLGKEKAVELVNSTLKRIGIPPKGFYSPDEVLQLCDEFANETGLVPVVAKLLKSQAHLRKAE